MSGNPPALSASLQIFIDAIAVSGVLFDGFQMQMGMERPTETVIIDGLNPQQVTLVRLSDYVARNLPTTWFQRDFLPRFQGD